MEKIHIKKRIENNNPKMRFVVLAERDDSNKTSALL
jgi:hypothetical protein